MANSSRFTQYLPRWQWLAFSLTVTAIGVVLILLFTAPQLYRWHMMGKIDSSDSAEQMRALNFIAHRIREDPAVYTDTMVLLKTSPQSQFVKLVGVLDQLRMWDREFIPPGPWLRRIELIAEQPDVEARILAAQLLAELPDLADDPRVLALLSILMQHEDPAVRLNTLVAAAQLAPAADDVKPYRRLIAEASDDANQAIAYHAWILRGLLNISPDAMPPRTPLAKRPQAMQLGYELAAQPQAYEPADPPEDDALAVIDALILGQTPITPDRLNVFFASPKPVMRELGAVLAARHLDEAQNRELARELLTSLSDNRRMSGALLAGLTGIEPIGIEGNMPAVLAAEPDLTEADLREMSDAELQRLGLQRRNILDYWIEHHEDWAVRQHMRLAKWMMGGLPEMTEQLPLLFQRSDMPRTTLALGMLKRGDARGLDILVNPRGQPWMELVPLLGGSRWYYAIEPYWREIVGEDAPVYDWWASAMTQTVQADVLSDWLLVHRRPLIRNAEQAYRPASKDRSSTQ